MKTDETLATRQSLLERLKQWSDQQSWQEFFQRYWRLIYNTARQCGLSDAEAQDVVQDTVIYLAQNIKGYHYDRARASFRTWLLRVARWRILDQIRRRQKERPLGEGHHGSPAEDRWEQIPDPAGLNLQAIWDEEWQRNLYTAALETVKGKVTPQQMQLFDLYVTQEWPVTEICTALSVSAARVYLAKHRVSRLIEKEVRRLEQGL